MHYIKAPDFPTGGQLIIGEDLKTAYETGKGKIIIRATTKLETEGDKQSIIITSLPYQTNKVQLLQKIAELKESNKDKLEDIGEIRDESDKNGMRAVIKLKKDANAKAILDYLYKSTGMQVSFGINMVAIAGGKPKLMGLMEIISYYVEYQRLIIQRRTKFDLDACKERAHIIEGLLVAIKNIDEVVKIIKSSATTQDAKQRLRDRFDLSEKQAQAILDMRLARLVNLEITKLEEEYAMLPVWLLNTKWNGENFLFAVNGQTGEMTGNLPIDKKKQLIWNLSVGVIIFLLTLLLGGSGSGVFLFGAIFALIGVLITNSILVGSMKPVHKKLQAQGYIKQGSNNSSINLSVKEDNYINTTVKREQIKQN